MKIIKKHIFIILLLLTSLPGVFASSPAKVDDDDKALLIEFHRLNIPNLSFEAYKNAIEGFYFYKSLEDLKGNLIAIIDFDLPSTDKRLFIIDVEKNEVLYSSLVAHGRNSGTNLPTKFSNIIGSYQSSIGFFRTGEKYIGKHGASLRLDGLELNVNDNARIRNIVIHSADYVSEDFIYRNSRLGRSLGCPALPKKDFKKVMDFLDDEILLYVYSSIK
ncbi:MAG: murein L,D-transpeptidase catalytic domain family protein [Flavobacteriales bacterium]|nr:murein L,D-transpeptidase catalytic domain family protein [Flavobacteriales bacterium]